MSLSAQPKWGKQSFKYIPKNKPQKQNNNHQSDKSTNVIVLQDGLVLMKKIIPPKEQQLLLDLCIDYGLGKHPEFGSFYSGKFVLTSEGFYDTDDSAKAYNKDTTQVLPQQNEGNKLNLVTKARMSIPIGHCPKQFLEASEQYLKVAREHSSSLPAAVQKVCRINYYTQKGKIGWHCDRDGLSEEEQKTIKSPIISLSLGSSAVFKYKNKIADADQEVVLESGDVIIFGGPSRMILHSVPKVYGPETIPQFLQVKNFKGRFNIGFY